MGYSMHEGVFFRRKYWIRDLMDFELRNPIVDEEVSNGITVLWRYRTEASPWNAY